MPDQIPLANPPADNPPRKQIVMWSSSSWATWKQCPAKFKIRSAKWDNPQAKSDNRLAVLAVPGLVVDRLFELWLHRKQFQDADWLKDNFAMVWDMTLSKQKPKWSRPKEAEELRVQTFRSAGILFRLLHQHGLLEGELGIQTEFHEQIAENISIAGAIDLWTLRPDGRLIVVDFKNFGSAGHRSADQLHFYSIALKRLFGRDPDEAGYVCFHPAYPGYRQQVLRPCDRNKLMARLQRATADRLAGKFRAKYCYFTCPHLCEVRFACPVFMERCGRSARPTSPPESLNPPIMTPAPVGHGAARPNSTEGS